MIVSEEFLLEKLKGYKQKTWSGHWTNKGNIHFILWNLLGIFNGHYNVVVNPETFEYRVKKHSEYGNIVSYLPTKETTVWTKENMSQEQIDYIEPCIAKALYDLLYPSIFSYNTKEGYSQWLFLWMMIRLNLPGNGENKLKNIKYGIYS